MHNLALPLTSSKPQALQQPLAIDYCILKGKQRQGSPQRAVVTHLSEREAWIVLEGDQPELFDDLVLIFPTSSGNGSAEVYAKVREQRNGHWRVVFSLISTGIKELIDVRGAA
jgi:hypothetical protein